MHIQARDFTIFVKKILPFYFKNKNILDVGAGDINGNNRFLFEDCIYQANDVVEVQNITHVSKTKDLPFENNFFDTIISTECFEHDPEWEQSLKKIYEMLKPNGLFCFTCASTNRPEHGTRRTSPGSSYGTIGNLEDMRDYYKNLTQYDINNVLKLKELFSTWDIYYNYISKDLYFIGIKKCETISQNIIFKEYIENGVVNQKFSVLNNPNHLLNESVCLNMIVKNEKHIIKETLDNICNYIDFSYWVISDTGSTDGTQEFVKEYFKEKNIPGELFQDEWRDFAYNRNLAIEHAFNKSDYLFFFDADDLIHGDFKLPDKLTKDVYQFKFGSGFSYDRICLINNREKIAKYVGVLHELLNVYKPNFTIELIDGEYHFESRRLGDRSKNPDKYKNDAEILEKAYNSEITDLGLKYRYGYYCAQSYRDANLIEKSIEWFKIFLDLPADNQYKYSACNYLGDSYKKLNNMEEAINYWYKAIHYDRERRETVVKIMEYYFTKENHFAIHVLYDKMKNYKLTNTNGKIFLDMTTYYDIDYYNSIASCYIEEWMSGYYSCKNLLLNDKHIEITLENFTCYAYNMHLDEDKEPFIDKLLELFEKYFDSKKELVKNLWNMLLKHIREYLPEINESNELLTILKNYKTSAWTGHIEFANWIVDLIKPKIVVDLGVDHGHSTYAFASRKIGQIYGIDCFDGDEHAGFRNTEQDVNNFKKELIDKNLLIDNITFIKGYFIDIYKNFDKEIDILHIDGLNHYENVKEDFETWVTKTHDNSIILFHDVISFPNTVGKFFQEISYPKFYFSHCHGLGVACKNFNLLRKLYYSPNIPYKENIIFKEKKNYCFIHSCNIKETGTKTLEYLIDKIYNSGLINNLDKIFINNIGIPIEKDYGHKFEINNYSKDINLYETPTINIIHNFSETNSDCNILYLHTKGITHINNLSTQQNNIKNWVDMMLYFLVENFELCFDKLNNNDAIGCNYYTTEEEAYHLICTNKVVLHFSGNFWWSKSNYIKTLPKLDITKNINKYDAELWLCKNNPTVHVLHNSHVNHYLQNYPRERYVIKKFRPSKKYLFNKLNDKHNEIESKIEIKSKIQHKIPIEEASNKILIYTGYMNFLWNDSTLKEQSIGGAEKAVIYLSRCLPKNYEIFIAGDQLEEEIDNIKYVNHNNLQNLLNNNTFHTIIVSRYVSFFEEFKNIKCGQLVVSSHDNIGFINFTKNNSVDNILRKNNKDIDYIICLTEWHKNNIIERHDFLKDKIKIINNGINIQDFNENNENINLDIKVKNRFIWSSCAYRGLHIMLELWPKILEIMPDATLEICSYDTFPKNKEEEKMLEIINIHSSITHHGKLNTQELYKLANTCEYWLYTTTFSETSCITAMEMLMCGVICIYYPLAGLNDTIGEYGIKVERGNEIETILNLSKERKTELREKGIEYALTCSWENRAEEWSNMLGLNNFKDYSVSDERIRYLHNNFTLPEDHIKFLKKLGNEFKPNVIYDIGANVLNWTKEAHKIWNDSEICVFDAVKSFENFYKSQGYKYFTGVLSDSNDKYVKFYQNNEHPAGNSYYKEIGHKNSYIIYPESNYTNEKTITLSKVVENLKFPMPDLIKFDVQGAELDIIKGSLDIINHAKYLIVEIQNKQYNKNAPLFDETVNFLEINGWELVTKKPFCDNGPDGDYCFKKKNKIGIFNSFAFHYEMFGFILNYAKNNDIIVDIFTNTENHLGWIEFYRETFNNFNIIDFKKFNGNTANYLSFFVTTDDDPLFKTEWIDNNVVCLNHFYKIRTPNFKHYLNIAKFKDSLLDYSYPCYPLVNYNEKKQNNTVSIIGVSSGFDFNIINRLYSSGKIQLNIFVRKSYNIDTIELDTTKFNINFIEDIETNTMIKTLKQTSYIFINYNLHPDRENGMSCSGSLQLALSTLCKPIITNTSNKYLQIKNALEFDIDSNEPINIDEEIDFKAIEEERNNYIDMFDNYITKIKQKQVALIVEPRKLEKLDKIITNIHNKLNNNSRYKWYILFYCGKGLKTYYLSLFHNIDITIIELDTNNFTFMEYNDFLKSLSLWNTINSEYTLVFQADCYIFNNPPYTIDYFIDKNYSYIGGNMSYQWNELEYHKTNSRYRNFNGGLSLRKTKDMINIIHSFKPQQSIEKLDKFETYGEDVYSTIGAYKLNLKIGNTKDDQHFACHSIITDKCFGIHNSDAYLDKKQLLDIYPEIYNQPYIINDNVKKELVIKNMYINNDCWSLIEDDNIIFMETNEIDKEFLSNKKSPFVLVTANNLDYPSGHNNDIEILNNPYLIKWFGTFPAISHPKFSPLPLGPKANWKETMFLSEYMNTNIYDIASKDINPLVRNRKSLLYCNFSNTTSNPYIKEHKNCRIKLWEILKNIKIPVTNSKSQKDYLTDLSIYVYCLCPPGNGCDSHRLWEALMMNCIPVVIKYEPISELYKNLPVLVLDKWEDLTVELLNSKKEYFSNFDFNRELIYKKYYIDKIKKEAQPIYKLQHLQNKIKITGGDFKEELIEQIIATKYINENDKVLEIGGNIGRNSMIIASLLNKTENLTVMESDQNTFKILKHNKEINNMNFKIINAGLSKKKLLQNSWDTYYSDSIENKHNYFKVNNITYQDLINKTGGDFNVLVLDCEGAFYYILKEFPEIITNIDKILIENDYKTIEEKKYVDDILFNNNFVSVFKDYHPDKWGPFYNKFYEVYIKTIKQKKIIDCFIFYNELELLTYRLNILNDFVDFFVIVESNHTFVGKEKPLFYLENKHSFEKFNDKIIHIIVDDFPHKYPNINFEKNQQWINEVFQRNCISRGLDKLSLQNNDIIIITDADEIPNPKILQQIKNKEILVDQNTLELDLYYFNLESKMDHQWRLSKIISYKNYKELGLSCEQIRQNMSFQIIKNGGWHLSYFGDVNFIRNKIQNYSHQEYNKVEFIDKKKIQERINNGKDLFDRPVSIINIPIEDNDNLPPDCHVYDLFNNNNYKYSQCWFLDSEIKKYLFKFLDKSKENKILEIGCFEGLSSVFFADNFLDNPNSTLTCVDPFLTINNNDHGRYLQNNEETNFDFNISNCKNSNKITIHKITSDKFFQNNNQTYNFIYIDGCHKPDFIKRDMENSFNILEKNGIMWMDDYRGGDGIQIKNTIDTFLEKWKGQYILIHNNYQLAIQKC